MSIRGYSSNVASIFDRLWGSYSDWFANSLHDTLVAEFNITQGRILDVGCGTGLFLETFARRSWNVFGVDPSEAMLGFARRRFSTICDLCRFSNGHLANFGIEGMFDVITCIYDTLNHARDETDIELFFSQCANSVTTNGIVVVDFNTSKGLEDWNRMRSSKRPTYCLFHEGYFAGRKGRRSRDLVASV